MKLNKIVTKKRAIVALAFTCVLLGIIFIFYHLLLKKPRAGNESHKIGFNVTSCFSCYGCRCTYTIDGKDAYTLNAAYKTKCIYDLDNGQVGKYHDYISKASQVANETGENAGELLLENGEFNNFMDCVRRYSE